MFTAVSARLTRTLSRRRLSTRTLSWRRLSWPFIVVSLFLFATLTCWAISSPVGSSPDDDFHQVSIWCGQGEREGLCEYTESPDERMVPAALVTTNCYAHEPDTTGACSSKALASGSRNMVITERGNFGTESGLYPPIYYTVMSVFASQDIVWSVITIRLVNSFLYLTMMVALCALLPAHRRPTLIVASVVTMIPVGVFLLASINPSAWALIAGATVPMSLVGYFETRGRRRIALAGLALLSTIVGSGARSDAALYIILTAIATIILFARRERRFWISTLWPLVLAAISAFFVLGAGQSASALSTSTASGGAGLLLDNALALPVMWAGALGAPSPIESWGLGWLDTAMPAIVWMSTLLVCGFAVFSGIASASGRKLFVVSSAFLALWAIPLYIIQSWGVHTGQWVQPRYILPLLTIFVAFALLRQNSDTENAAPPPWMPLTLGQTRIGTVALVLANSAALFTNIRRYTHGSTSQAIDLGRNPSWWWEGSIPGPMMIWVVGTLAFALLIFLLVRRINSEPIPVVRAYSSSM